MRRLRIVPSLVILGLLAALLTPSAVAAANPKDTGVKVLIGYDHHPRRADVRTIERFGGKVTRRFTIINAVAAEVPRGQLKALAREKGVRNVEEDARLTILDHSVPTGDLEWDNAWGVAHIGTPAVYNAGIAGDGIKVAVIDSGIDYLHDNPTANPPVYPEFNGIYAGGYDFMNGDNDPYDDNGHGTHVSGILAAAKNGYLVAGVAPRVQLFALKIVDANGEGQYSHLIAALQWVVNYNNTHADGIKVINMSVGAHDVSTALHAAIQAVAAQGVLMAAAAGNVNPLDFNELINGCPVVYPAAYPEVFATTFTQEQDALTGFSCTGPEVDVASPGDNILSTVPTGSCMFCSSTGYNWESGTSMASPHLAGLLALLLSAGLTDTGAPGLFDDARAAICSTADVGYGVISFFGQTPIPTTDPRYPQYFGCGVIDADGAVFGLGPPPTNRPPVAVDDTATTNEDTPVSIAVLANDTDADGDTLSVASVTAPAHGTAVKQANGTVTYTPAANYFGTDAFTYVVSDGAGGTDTGSVAVTVNSVNDPPVAVDDTATTTEGVATSIAVLANDTDVDGDTLTLVSVTSPAHGTAVANANGTVTYTPAAGYTGSDAFDYVVSDGKGGTDTGTVSLTVTAVNRPPVAVDDTASTPYQTPVTIPVLANDSDPDGDPLSVVGVGAASHGAVTIGAGGSSVTYTPAAGYSGPDSFNYTVSDGHGGSDVGTVSVTVGAAPPPVNPFHVGDLDGSTTKSRNNWSARVTITVHTASHLALSGAVVTGTWSAGGTVTVQCTTNSNGKCTVQSGKLSTSLANVTFTVTLVTKSGATYVATSNHDPDGDSDGTTITLARP